MLGPGAHRLVLHEQAKTGHQCELCTPGPAEQLGGSNRRTAQGGNDDIGIQYNFLRIPESVRDNSTHP